MADWTDRLAIVSDEAAEDFSEAVEVCLPLGIRAYELRKLPGGRVPYAGVEATEAVLATTRRHNLRLIGISPGFFRGKIDDPSAEVQLRQGFEDAFRLMDHLGVRRMTVFSFLRGAADEAIPLRVIEHLRHAADLCRRQGVELLIENIAGHWADTGEHLGQLARATGLRVTWDPANAAASGEIAYPGGYSKVRDLVAHFHCKNWQNGAGNVAILDGVVDMQAQVKALTADGYSGCFCLEPHQWNDRANATRLNAAQLLQILPGCAR